MEVPSWTVSSLGIHCITLPFFSKDIFFTASTCTVSEFYSRADCTPATDCFTSCTPAKIPPSSPDFPLFNPRFHYFQPKRTIHRTRQLHSFMFIRTYHTFFAEGIIIDNRLSTFYKSTIFKPPLAPSQNLKKVSFPPPPRYIIERKSLNSSPPVPTAKVHRQRKKSPIPTLTRTPPRAL